MSGEVEIRRVEDRYFQALLEGDREQLDAVIGGGLVLIDVLSGSEVPGDAFADLVGSGQLVFDSIERVASHVRFYVGAAIVTGATHMQGHSGDQHFDVHSRYPHVYVRGSTGWRLVAAQGTPMGDGTVPINPVFA